MMARLAGLGRADARPGRAELLERFDLADAGATAGSAPTPAACAAGWTWRPSLVGRPSVIFLDEPTTGLDLPSRQAMWQIIGELVATGVTVFLTTQYLEEADRLADRIAVIDGGAIVAEGTAGRAQAAGRRPAAGPRRWPTRPRFDAAAGRCSATASSPSIRRS